SIMVISSMFTVNAKLAIYALAPIPVLSAVILFINKLINKRSEKIQEQLSALSSFVQETFSGIRVIKTYSREQDKKNSFAKESNDYKTVSLSLVKVQAVFFPRSEEHTSELQSRENLVCRHLLAKKDYR